MNFIKKQPFRAEKNQNRQGEVAKFAGAPRSAYQKNKSEYRSPLDRGVKKFAFAGDEDGENPFKRRQDKPFRSRNDRDDRGERPFRPSGDRPFRPRQDREDRPFRPSGDRPFRPRQEGEDRPFRKREDGDFKPRQDREDRPFRPRGDRPFRPKRDGDDFKTRQDRPRRQFDRDEKPRFERESIPAILEETFTVITPIDELIPELQNIDQDGIDSEDVE